MPYSSDRAVCFVETKLFSRLVGEYMADDEYASMQQALVTNPKRGAVVPGTGGVRKLRWAGSGRGKRGGIRVIYYARGSEGMIWLLTVYAKNETSTIPLHVLRQIRKELDA